MLSNATLDCGMRLGDIQWSGVGAVNLTQITWDALPTLGDEQGVTPRSPVKDHDAAVRANRQLATALRDQGMNEEADRFAYRAQVLQRQVFHQQHERGRAVFSWFLDRVAGHGYRPERSPYTYIGVIVLFALLCLLAGNGLLTLGLPASQYAAHGLPWYEALILSISSFYGRGFFQPLQTPGDPVAVIASVEAIFGLFIEVSFIPAFTQRFFGK